MIVIAGLAALFARPALLAFKVFASHDAPSIALPDRPPPRDAAEARAQDLADLSRLPEYDNSFTDKTAGAFRAGVGELSGRAGAMSDAAFMMAVSRLVALAGNGHTTVSKDQRTGLFGRAPVRLAWFADGLYVVRAAAPFDRLLGQRLVALDGRPLEKALTDIQPYLSGTAERARDDTPPILETPALLKAVWPDTDGQIVAFDFEGAPNQRLGVMPPAPDPFAHQPILTMVPLPAGAPGDRWRTVLDGAVQIPLSLRVPARVVFSAPLDRGGVYVRINAIDDDERGPLADQLAEIAAGKPAGGWRWMVLDLRFNNGGYEDKTMAFTRALPDLVKDNGSLWILTGNATFSAAIVTAARAKYFVGSRAHIVGETVGDRNPFWATGGAPLVLRNAGIAINHAYFKEDWVHGCRDVQTCFPWQFVYGVAAGDLSPEVTVGWTFADYAAGRDTVMERVEALEAEKP